MKITKILALIIALAMSLTLAACGDEASSNIPNNQNTNAENLDNGAEALSTNPTQGNGGNETQSAESEFLYAQLGISGNSDESGKIATITQVAGGSLLFTGAGVRESSEFNFFPPRISNFTLFINGEAHEPNVHMPLGESSFLWSMQHVDHYPYASKDEDTVKAYSLTYGVFEECPAEYYFEVMVNDVLVRSNTFVWNADGSGEFLDDMPQPSSRIMLTHRDSIVPPDSADPNERGISNSNIAFEGYVAEKGDWIYMLKGSSIYKMSADGSELIKLEQPGYYFHTPLNVIGDFIYANTSNKGMFRLRTDGLGLQKIPPEGISSPFIFEGDWIYYNDYSGNSTNVCRIRTDGTEDTQLTTEGSCFMVGIEGDWVYYRQGYEGEADDTIFRVKKDGSARDSIILPVEHIYRSIVDGDWIYYTENRTLHKFHIDTKENVTLIEKGCEQFVVSGDKIFYFPDRYGDTPIGLRSIGTDGTGDVQLNNADGSYLNVAGDWLFYKISDEIYRIHTDGTGDELIIANSSS
ncbi:MAG: DUF5050 domain-containing protein [Oscillospiraceae bacterium]|nr:DUF5050 domain-containing protein [Oscillospiraceae bacterium]